MIRREELVRMAGGAAARIRDQHDFLSQLDSAAGDGDHGTTMLRIVESLEKTLADSLSADLRTLLREAGWAVLGVNGGAAGALFGSFFLGMADTPAEGCGFDCRGLAATFECGMDAITGQTGARLGDKTLLDALIPAVRALRQAADSGKGILEALHDAALAASAGARATAEMVARFGRAKYLGEKTRGYQDPGATSVALMFDGFYHALAQPEGEIQNA